ncbi:unnamed protein product [Strongylus vulgaris]|uniref:Major facilitator superfamily (MFS) profile domain-containing protein n=1 Tax=Strongylus vulgaris TaxID=40348 RepID=A0A3P7L5Y9_STRVU|nr:unnamed protein product [Strongylus vulgaris]
MTLTVFPISTFQNARGGDSEALVFQNLSGERETFSYVPCTLRDAIMRKAGSIGDPDADAETRSAPGDLGGTPKRARATKWSHSRQASQGVPYRYVEKPRRIREIRDKQWQVIKRYISEELVINVTSTAEHSKHLIVFRPSRLSFLGSRKWMILLLCWYCAVQGIIVNGFVPSAISSIERRFKLSTSTMGRIVQFYDFGYVLFCIPVSYFGGRHSKPAVLGAGLALIATGSILFSTPHMLADSYSANQDEKAFGSCSIKSEFAVV